VTSGEMVVLPKDISRYGIDPNSFEVAKAIRMSASIPYFFEPVKIRRKGKKIETHYIVDGGLLSNFPVWIFDRDQHPRWPTFGFRLISEKTGQPNRIYGPISLGFALISTMLEAHDTKHIKEQDFVRSILVPSIGIHATDFAISREQSKQLFQSGVQAANKFFNQWNFHQYAIKYRSSKIKI